jgi:hypothetical protein
MPTVRMAVSLCTVALLNRTRSPKPARPIRPRVYLSKEESRSVNAVKPNERKICLGLALWAAIYMTVLHFHEKGSAVGDLWKLGVMLAAVAAFVFLAMKTNRLAASLGGLLCVYVPVVEGAKSSALFFLPSLPLLALMMWLSFRISGDRRKLTEEKAARGDFGTDPRSRAASDRKVKKGASKTEDSTGRVIAPASKRYTPPKAKKR